MKLRVFIASLIVLLFTSTTFAFTTQMPEWYRLSARLDSAPVIKKSFKVIVKLTAIIGDIQTSKIKLLIPDKWIVKPYDVDFGLIRESESKSIVVEIIPTTFVSPGSILIEALIRVPTNQIKAEINRKFPETASEMIKAVNRWASTSKRHTDVSFLLTPEESMYPVSGNIWCSYNSKLKLKGSLKGPVYYNSGTITDIQAQTDIDMFDKLKGYLQTDKNLIVKLNQSGISIAQKKLDQLVALYTLAARAFARGDNSESEKLLRQFEREYPRKGSQKLEYINIASGNLIALNLWNKGQNRLAKSRLKKIFYKNKKHPLQRYTLRNLGLLMLSENDKKTAIEMYRLALRYSPSYTLLINEYKHMKKR